MEIRRRIDSGDTMTSREIEIVTDLRADDFRSMMRKESNRRAAMRMLAIANELAHSIRENDQ